MDVFALISASNRSFESQLIAETDFCVLPRAQLATQPRVVNWPGREVSFAEFRVWHTLPRAFFLQCLMRKTVGYYYRSLVFLIYWDE